MDSPLPHPVVADRYALVAPLGSGATSRVFRAHDLLLDRPVALKLLRPCGDELASQRLRDEALIASGLHHPGIARVVDHGDARVDGELRPYLAMELVEGSSLREVLRGGPLPAEDVRHLLEQVADALAHAHGAGVVHRDVKPANIVLTPDGRAVLLDFGIARRADLEPLTLTGMIVGTVDYLSSEQASGRSATPRSDLYSLGCVAYEALTGLRPFQRDTIMETVAAHATSEAEPLPSELPAGLRALIEQLVRRDPAERPADAATVAQLAREPERQGMAGPARPARPAEAPETEAPRAEPRVARAGRHPGIRGAGAAVATAAALAALLTAGQVDPESSPAVAAGASTRVVTTPSRTPSPTAAPTSGRGHQPASGTQRRRRAALNTAPLAPAVPTAASAAAAPAAGAGRHGGTKPSGAGKPVPSPRNPHAGSTLGAKGKREPPSPRA